MRIPIDTLEFEYPSRVPMPGDEIIYTLPTGRSAGQDRYGHVVRLFGAALAAGRANLSVMTDWTNDFDLGQYGANGLLWVPSAPYGTHGELGTWRYKNDIVQHSKTPGRTHPATPKEGDA